MATSYKGLGGPVAMKTLFYAVIFSFVAASSAMSGKLSSEKQAQLDALLQEEAIGLLGKPGRNHEGLRQIQKGDQYRDSENCEEGEWQNGSHGRFKRVTCDGKPPRQ